MAVVAVLVHLAAVAEVVLPLAVPHPTRVISPFLVLRQMIANLGSVSRHGYLSGTAAELSSIVSKANGRMLANR